MKFNVTVLRIDEREVTRHLKHVETGEKLEDKHKGRVAIVRTSKGGKEYPVVLWPEDDEPMIGARMKLIIPGANSKPGERAILVEREGIRD